MERIIVLILLCAIFIMLLVTGIRLKDVQDQQKKDHQLLCYVADAVGVDSPSAVNAVQVCAGNPQ